MKTPQQLYPIATEGIIKRSIIDERRPSRHVCVCVCVCTQAGAFALSQKVKKKMRKVKLEGLKENRLPHVYLYYMVGICQRRECCFYSLG